MSAINVLSWTSVNDDLIRQILGDRIETIRQFVGPSSVDPRHFKVIVDKAPDDLWVIIPSKDTRMAIEAVVVMRAILGYFPQVVYPVHYTATNLQVKFDEGRKYAVRV